MANHMSLLLVQGNARDIDYVWINYQISFGPLCFNFNYLNLLAPN